MLSKQRVIERSGALPDELARRLRRSIERGELRQGERLPTQQELCDAYGVSRTVVREALSLLKSEGLVDFRQRRGQFVNREGNRAFRFQPDLDDADDRRAALDFLISVEAGAAERAAERRSVADLAMLRAALDAFARAAAVGENGGENGVEAEMGFRHAVLEAGHNPYVRQFGAFLESQARGLIGMARTVERLAATHGDHEAIHRAIADRDKGRARQAMAAHWANIGRCLDR